MWKSSLRDAHRPLPIAHVERPDLVGDVGVEIRGELLELAADGRLRSRTAAARCCRSGRSSWRAAIPVSRSNVAPLDEEDVIDQLADRRESGRQAAPAPRWPPDAGPARRATSRVRRWCKRSSSSKVRLTDMMCLPVVAGRYSLQAYVLSEAAAAARIERAVARHRAGPPLGPAARRPDDQQPHHRGHPLSRSGCSDRWPPRGWPTISRVRSGWRARARRCPPITRGVVFASPRIASS